MTFLNMNQYLRLNLVTCGLFKFSIKDVKKMISVADVGGTYDM